MSTGLVIAGSAVSSEIVCTPEPISKSILFVVPVWALAEMIAARSEPATA